MHANSPAARRLPGPGVSGWRGFPTTDAHSRLSSRHLSPEVRRIAAAPSSPLLSRGLISPSSARGRRPASPCFLSARPSWACPRRVRTRRPRHPQGAARGAAEFDRHLVVRQAQSAVRLVDADRIFPGLHCRRSSRTPATASLSAAPARTRCRGPWKWSQVNHFILRTSTLPLSATTENAPMTTSQVPEDKQLL